VVVWHVISVDEVDYANKITIPNWRVLCGDNRLSLALDESVEVDDLRNGAIPEE
jgi:hypothetical protein